MFAHLRNALALAKQPSIHVHQVLADGLVQKAQGITARNTVVWSLHGEGKSRSFDDNVSRASPQRYNRVAWCRRLRASQRETQQ